mgnify:CR=1 FL=1
MQRRSFVSVSALTAAGALLTACRGGLGSGSDGGVSGASASDGAPPGGGASDGASSDGGASAAPAEFQELEAHIMGQRVTARVSPLVRLDETATALVVELTRAADDAAVNDVQEFQHFDDILFASNYLGTPPLGTGADGVRLIDTAGAGRVWVAGSATGGGLKLKPGETAASAVIFAPVDIDQVTALVPQTGFVTVSVIGRDQADAAGISSEVLAEADKALKDKSGPGEKAAVVDLERYTRAIDDSASTHTTDKDVTVTLASDVTFESDSYNLTDKADAQLQTVADQIAQYPDGGTLDIVGHTDDVADDAHNQKLSEDRAAAVKDRLTQLTDLGKWQVTTTGKGESEPAVKDTTDEARAANRRVVTTITPTNGTQNGATPSSTPSAAPLSSSAPDGNLPESTGPAGKGPDGVTVPEPDGKGQVTFTLDHATRTGGLLTAQLTATTGPGGTGSTGLNMWLTDPLGPAITALTQSARGENGGMGAVEISEGLTLLADGQRVYPADYLPPGGDWHRPLTELNAADSLKEGAAITICVAWPDTGQDTLTLDHAAPRTRGISSYAYRLTDIPVTES